MAQILSLHKIIFHGGFNLYLKFTIIFLLFFISANVAISAEIPTEEQIKNNIEQVEAFYQVNSQTLPAEKVMMLSNKIIQQRQSYPSNIITKVYILLANVAKNKNDFSQAFQFAQDGLSLRNIELVQKLDLQLILASGYYSKGQYQQVIQLTNDIISTATSADKTAQLLLALAYRSMAFALVAQHDQAFVVLEQIADIVQQKEMFSENIQLLEILAIAHHYLGDYQTALTMQHQILKLRLESSPPSNLERTYYNLGSAYYHLGLLDDAYNAYWEAKAFAEKNANPIDVAVTQLGLGLILYLQQDYQASYQVLIKAEQALKGRNLPKAYLSTLIALAKSSLQTDRQSFAFKILEQARIIAEKIELTKDQIELHALLADKFKSQGKFEQAFKYLNKYLVLVQQFTQADLKSITLRNREKINRDKNKKMVIKLSQESELAANFSKKFKHQHELIVTLVLLVFILIILMTSYWFKQRSLRMHRAYEEIEKPNDFLESPIKTKQIYKLAFKKARKFNYPLAIGYLSVDNWKELSFHFNKKTLAEVSKTIAILINEHISEFDQVGLINEGEYLLLCPHQTCQVTKVQFEKLLAALKVRFFANLGEFSVNISFACKAPNIQDIDPYIFLSKLSESVTPNSIEH